MHGIGTFWDEWLAQAPEAFALLIYAFGLLVVTWPVFLLLEKRWPVVDRPEARSYAFSWKIVGTNVALTPLFYALAMTIGIKVASLVDGPFFAYPVLQIHTGWAALDSAAQGMALFLTACFLGDLWYYWWHRWQHAIPILWEFHKLHHSDEDMNATTIYRSHFFELAGQALVRGLSVGVIIDLGEADDLLVGIVAAGILPPLWDIFIHSNVDASALRQLVPFFSTPQYHWIHHSSRPEHQDKNFAIWLPLFDILFGSYHRPEPEEFPPTGLSSGERIETVWQAQAGPFVNCIRRDSDAARDIL